MPECLDDNTAAEFASGSLPPAAARRVDAHLATCRSCRTLVAALAPIPGVDSELDTVPREVAAPRGKRGRGHTTRVAQTTTVPSLPAAPGADRGPGLGDTIGRYLVLGRLGAGGMGVVLSAYDPQLDRRVALKLLRAGTGLAAPEARARLVREAQAIAQLSHPNVVAVYDVGTAASGEVYLAMELVDGETLTRWVRAWDRPWREVLDTFLQAGRGLAAAHAVGLLHRDFKPDNVLVGADGRVRVTDFGLARSLLGAPGDEQEIAEPRVPGPGALHESLTATGAVLGTPRYMAPEQLRGRDADARADQFSFCVALYEAIYGRHPLAGDTAQRMIDQGARAAAPPDGPVPAWVGRALLRGLEAEPARRFPSMSSLLGELAPPPARARRWTALGLGASLVAGGAAMAWVAQERPAPAPFTSTERDELLDRIRDLETERRKLLTDLETAPARERDVLRLRDELRTRDEQIHRLVARVAVLEAPRPLAPPRPTAPPAPRPAGLSLTAAAGAMERTELDVAACLREWASRHPDDDRHIAVSLAVLPEGRTHSVAADGLGSDPTVDCVATAIARTRFPARSAQTRLRIMASLAAGAVHLTPEILAVAPAPPTIDLASAPPP